MGGRATRMIVAAVVAVLLEPPLLGLLAVSVLEVGDARRAINEVEADHGEAVLSRADTLVDRLQDERDWRTFELLGFSDVVGPVGRSTPRARSGPTRRSPTSGLRSPTAPTTVASVWLPWLPLPRRSRG